MKIHATVLFRLFHWQPLHSLCTEQRHSCLALGEEDLISRYHRREPAQFSPSIENRSSWPALRPAASGHAHCEAGYPRNASRASAKKTRNKKKQQVSMTCNGRIKNSPRYHEQHETNGRIFETNKSILPPDDIRDQGDAGELLCTKRPVSAGRRRLKGR